MKTGYSENMWMNGKKEPTPYSYLKDQELTTEQDQQ